MRMHLTRSLSLLLTLAACPAFAQNLIPDGSLETGNVAVCDQGQVPDTWFNTSGTADTYTFDCAVQPGLSVQPYPHFTSLAAAEDGLRFIAGWSAANETFGTALSQALVPGAWYDVRAKFVRSDSLGGDGSYAIWLSMDASMGGAVHVANIGGLETVGAWSEDIAHFQAPAAFTHMILQPVGVNYYSGSDSWSIEAVNGPETFCVSAVNSTGREGRISFQGSVSVATNQFELVATDLPVSVPGQFFYGFGQTQVPFGDGYRCITGERRLPPLARSDATGRAARQVDLAAGGIAAHAIPGSELYFQLWYRDGAAGGSGFNLTDGLVVRFQ